MAVLGCIADDFTGAGDAASFLVKGGMTVQLFNGIPDQTAFGETNAQALVIALKSRTQESAQAVSDSLSAAVWLKQQGVKQIYFKYCSTFDSLPSGNIGPVADRLLEFMDTPYTILCPALPVNKRTVVSGRLLVDGVPLDESHMKHHPLTPMWHSKITELMKPQSKYPAWEEDGAQEQEKSLQKHYYLVPDYVLPEDGACIVERFGDLPLLTGGSGLLEPLARRWSARLKTSPKLSPGKTDGRAVLIAGSCSMATLEQITWYRKTNAPCYNINPESILRGEQTADTVWAFVKAQEGSRYPVLLYSSDVPEKVREYQALGTAGRVAQLLEDMAAEVARRAVADGYTRIIAAGGETSGAVTKALGFSSYWIGETVAPGVPVMIPVEQPQIRLILKSGNFGQADFFERAVTMTEGASE